MSSQGVTCTPPNMPPALPTLQHLIAWRGSATVAAAAIPALVAAGGDVRGKSRCGREPLHVAIEHNKDRRAAAAAVAALLAAGADPTAATSEGKLPIELALEREDAAECADLLKALLGTAAGQAAANGAGPSNAAGQAAGADAGAGPSSGSGSGRGVQQVLQLAAAAFRQLAKGKRPAEPAQPAARECPVCLEPGACMTGPCGHLVCEDCAKKDQVRTGHDSWARGGRLHVCDRQRLC